MSFYSIAQYIQQYYPEYYSIETYPVEQCVRIHKITEEWGIFSNFARTPMTVEGAFIKNAEQLFQMMKFKDKETVMSVYLAGNPKMTAKRWERTHRREDWGSMIVDAIKFCIMQKYQQSKAFREALEASRGLFIIEDQTSFTKKNPDTWGVKQQGENFVGPNLLGRLLMELRDIGTLTYTLPDDALDFIGFLKKSE